MRAGAADVVAFQSNHSKVDVRKAGSVLRAVDAFKPLVGGGTNTWPALRSTFDKHDRVIILTDEQAFADARSGAVPAEGIDVPIYSFNLAGYRVGHLPSGGHQRYTFGGLSDRAFAAIALLERGRDVDWKDAFKASSPGKLTAEFEDEGEEAG